jgi:hypothetical protein
MISDDLLKKAVAEAYSVLAEQFNDVSKDEKAKQNTTSDNIDDEGIRKEVSSKTEVEEEEEKEKDDSLDLVKSKSDDEEKFSYEIPDKIPKNIQFKDVMAQLNSVRSGASTKDDEVRQGLLKYFDNLESNERQKLFSMLSGFATIMNKAGDVEDAPVPDKKEKPSGPGEAPAMPAKKIGNAPIVVGESATKDAEFMVVLENTKEKHRCATGRVVTFGSEKSLNDINNRISDAAISRNACERGSEARSHYNGLLKYLRMQLRAAQKTHDRDSNS